MLQAGTREVRREKREGRRKETAGGLAFGTVKEEQWGGGGKGGRVEESRVNADCADGEGEKGSGGNEAGRWEDVGGGPCAGDSKTAGRGGR